jgi:hypothetical protein
VCGCAPTSSKQQPAVAGSFRSLISPHCHKKHAKPPIVPPTKYPVAAPGGPAKEPIPVPSNDPTAKPALLLALEIASTTPASSIEGVVDVGMLYSCPAGGHNIFYLACVWHGTMAELQLQSAVNIVKLHLYERQGSRQGSKCFVSTLLSLETYTAAWFAAIDSI